MIARRCTKKTTVVVALAGLAMGAPACAWPGSIQYTSQIGAPPKDGTQPVDLPKYSPPTVVTVDAQGLQPGRVRKPTAAAPQRASAPRASMPVSGARTSAPPTAPVSGRTSARSTPGAPRPAANSAGATTDVPPLNISRITFATEGADFDPCVTPDGARLVYASTQHRTTADIYVKPVDGRVLTQLTNDPADDLMPAVSPDGSRVAFASNRSGNWDIFIMPMSGGRAVQVTSDSADEIHPSWSPDGNELVFSRMGEASGRWEMWVTDSTNQATSSFIGFGLFPQWCPAAGTGAGGADRILYQLTRERGQRAFGLWTVDFREGQTGNTTEIAASGKAAFINPTWSPDGQRIVYAAVPNPSEWNEIGESKPSSAELWMINVDGTGRVNLTPGSTVSLMPSWGLKNKLYFVAARGATDNIWSIDVGSAIQAASGRAPVSVPPTARQAQPTRHIAPVAVVPASHEAPSEQAQTDGDH